MGPYAPPPPPGAQPPPLWGGQEHVRELFGTGVSTMDTKRQHVVFAGGEPAEFREYWQGNYGPTISVYRFNEQDPQRVAALDQAFVDFLAGWNHGGRYEAEYLMIAARTRE